jgi:signal transduction histidine kinase
MSALIFGIMASSLVSLMSYLPVYYAYVVPGLSGLAISFTLKDPEHYFLALLSVLYLVVMLIISRTLNRMIRNTISTRFENLELIEALKEQHREAEQANQSKSRFLAAASHDLRQPLHALSLLLGALETRIERDDAREILGQASASTRALTNLFDSLLDISKLDSSTLIAERSDFNLQILLNRINIDFRPVASDRQIQLHVDDCAMFVNSDPNMLERLIRNLVSNAIRYTQQGSVSIDCMKSDQAVCLQITDTGIGIPADQHENIFMEFFQLNNPERDRSKGLGLGLAIVQRLAHLLEIKISLDSTPGRGTRFSLLIPAGDEQASGQLSEQAHNLLHGDIAGMVVAVVDDEVSIRSAIEHTLQSWQCRPVSGETAEQIDSKLQQQGLIPDVILSDYRLREGDTGLQHIAMLREKYGHDVPAVIITGDLQFDSQNNDPNNDVPVLYKPIQPARLRALLNSLRR